MVTSLRAEEIVYLLHNLYMLSRYLFCIHCNLPNESTLAEADLICLTLRSGYKTSNARMAANHSEEYARLLLNLF